MVEKKNLFLEGFRGEMGDLIHSCIELVKIAQRQADGAGTLTAAEVNDRGRRLIQMLMQLDYLKSDFADLFYSREPDFELSLELMNISQQLELVCSSIQEQIQERGWNSQVILESPKALFANINPGYFYTACANIVANLCYYAEEQKDIHIQVTEDRTVDVFMEGAALPQMVVALAEEYGETADISQVGVGTYGLLFAVQFCRAMNWRLSFHTAGGNTHVVLQAPAVSLSTTPRERLASEMALQVQQRSQATLRTRRAFSEMFTL